MELSVRWPRWSVPRIAAGRSGMASSRINVLLWGLSAGIALLANSHDPMSPSSAKRSQRSPSDSSMKLSICLKPSFANIRSDAKLRAAASAVTCSSARVSKAWRRTSRAASLPSPCPQCARASTNPNASAGVDQLKSPLARYDVRTVVVALGCVAFRG